jgi:pimeloyl-ACP methyl ester carboxylesterase
MGHAVSRGFRVAGLDTTGDRRDDPAPAPPTWESLSGEVAGAVERLGGPAVLWGTSFGCVLALATAARHPERVSGLLLCYPPLPGRVPRLHAALHGWLLKRPALERRAMASFRVAFVVLNGWELVTPGVLVRLPALARESWRAATPGTTILRKLDLLWNHDVGLPSPDAPIPTVVVAGRWDGIAPFSGARDLVERLPGARLRELPFSGHAGAYSRPRTYHRIVVEELGALVRPRPGVIP